MANDAVQKTLDRVLTEGIVLAVRLGPDAPVVDVCRAAAKGGVRVLELTLTTPGALEAISALSEDPTLTVGGGTVLTTDDVRRVHDAGGRFCFSPVFDADVVDAAHSLELLAVPGAGSPAEVLAAHRHGACLVKVFPSGALGGAAFLHAVKGPFPDIPIIPTSGPTADTIDEYLSAGAVAVGVGGAEFFPEGFSTEHIENAARRVREAFDARRKA